MTKPRIGVTRCSALGDYLKSVEDAGGEPVVLEPTTDPARALAEIDGLLLTGGADVDPALYGAPPHEKTEADAARDAFEIPLTREAIAHDVPLFAICRGVQVLNVAAGGTLVQDLPSEAPSEIAHSVEHPKDARSHDVRVTPGSRLAEAMGAGSAIDVCPVNSRHHQAVARIASSFVVSAISDDGIVEAIERPGASFCLGVQWHPENFWRTGEFAPLFSAFVHAAAARRGRE
ncbi:MAG TPA: gamma-glutamyl-gamma-aminobutyrate hydrolase family protein [Vicinamibacterales bacterium]|nr:gamma-glutamyl-gamma-aminobutyrate hydrolase family protein [Vicinamibacterales bacterium]